MSIGETNDAMFSTSNAREISPIVVDSSRSTLTHDRNKLQQSRELLYIYSESSVIIQYHLLTLPVSNMREESDETTKIYAYGYTNTHMHMSWTVTHVLSTSLRLFIVVEWHWRASVLPAWLPSSSSSFFWFTCIISILQLWRTLFHMDRPSHYAVIYLRRE